MYLRITRLCMLTTNQQKHEDENPKCNVGPAKHDDARVCKRRTKT